MRKTLLLTISILFCTLAHGFEHTDSVRTFKINIPDDFKIKASFQNENDNLRAIYTNSKSESLAILYYYAGGTIDKPKAKKAPISDLFSEDGLKIETQSKGEKYDVANLYYNKSKKSYIKVYRIVNTDGVVLLVASSNKNAFQRFDAISESYKNYISKNSIATTITFIIILLAGCVIGYSAYAYLHNTAKLITYCGSSLFVILLLVIFSTFSINSIFFISTFSAFLSYLTFRFNLIFF